MSEQLPSRPAFDPLTGPYIMLDCRSGRHESCAGGFDWYPGGLVGPGPVIVLCDCAQPGCTCRSRR